MLAVFVSKRKYAWFNIHVPHWNCHSDVEFQ